jgi:hypothetical protein
VGWCLILLEDVVAIRIHPLPGGQHPPAKGPYKFGVDSFANALKNNQTFLAVTSHHPQDHLLQRILGKDYADAGVHVGHRQVCQLAAVVVVDSHIPSENLVIANNPSLMRLAHLQLVK